MSQPYPVPIPLPQPKSRPLPDSRGIPDTPQCLKDPHKQYKLENREICKKNLCTVVDMSLLHVCVRRVSLHCPIWLFGHFFGPSNFCFIKFEAPSELYLTLVPLIENTFSNEVIQIKNFFCIKDIGIAGFWNGIPSLFRYRPALEYRPVTDFFGIPAEGYSSTTS